MNGYEIFARYYDDLTANIDYAARADFFRALIHEYGNGGKLALDLACGTGSLTVELAKRGMDMIGVDGSGEMLSQAMEKTPEAYGIQYLRQTMQGLDMYGTVDAIVCALDSINHIIEEQSLARCFSRVSLFLDPGGVFVFDANTVYKHEKVLADNVFVYECDKVYCVWQNCYDSASRITTIRLDFFEKAENNRYIRASETFEERAYSYHQLAELLDKAGLYVADCFADDSRQPINEQTQRMIIVAKKKRL